MLPARYANNSANAKTSTKKNRLETELKLASKINATLSWQEQKSYSKLAEEVARRARTNRKAAWKAVHECKLGTKINYKKKQWHSNYPTGVIKTVATFTHHAHIVMR
jgi:hypothetical protein